MSGVCREDGIFAVGYLVDVPAAVVLCSGADYSDVRAVQTADKHIKVEDD